MRDQFVIDTSALMEVLGAAAPDKALTRLVSTGYAHAPEMIELEAVSFLRKSVRRGAMSLVTAEGVLGNLRELPIARSPHRALLPRVWALRDSLTAYDAAFVALAEKLDCPLVTCDARLAKSHGHDVTIDLYPAS